MNSMCRRFIDESRGAAERFYGFLCCHKGVMLMLARLLLFLYGQRIVYYPMSIDSEIALQYQDGMIESWIAMDRFGSGFTKWLFGFSRFVPYASVFMMLIALFLFGMGFDFCVYEWTGGEKGYGLFYYIFPAAFVSAPCLAEQFYFTLQCFEVAFAMVLSLLAVYAMSRWAYFRGSGLWAVLCMAFMVWAFGTYQAFIPFYIALTLIAFILWYLRDDTYPSPEAEASKEGVRIGTGIFAKLSTPFRLGILQAAVFAAGFLLYIIIAQIVKSTIEFETAYVGSMFKWREIGLRAGLGNILTDIKYIYFAELDTFFSPLFLPLLILAMVLLLIRGYKRGRKGYWVFFIACGLLAASPIYITILSGNNQMIRSLFAYPLLFSFCMGYLTKLSGRVLKVFMGLLALSLVIGMANTTVALFHTAYLSYEQEKALSGALYERISQTAMDAGLGNTPRVVFVGKKGISLPGDALRGDVIGKSFFEWDQGDYAGSTRRIMGYWVHLGYYIAPPSLEDAEIAKEEAKDMPVWPATDSVRVTHGFIVVKLSD